MSSAPIIASYEAQDRSFIIQKSGKRYLATLRGGPSSGQTRSFGTKQEALDWAREMMRKP